MDWENKLKSVIDRYSIKKGTWVSPFWDTSNPVIDEEISPDDIEEAPGSSQIVYINPKDPSKKAYYVVVYIKFLKQFEGSWSLPKFHISRCATIDRFITGNKFNERYFVSRNKTNTLEIVKTDSYERQKIESCELKVCINCLKSINYKNYKYENKTRQEDIYSNFSLLEYFSIFIDTSVPLPEGVKKWLSK